MGWYYYLEGKLRFPFRAKCVTSKVVSPLRKGEVGEVSRMAPEDACSADMLALIRWQGRNVAVPLSQLFPLTQRNRPSKPSVTGTTGSHEVIAFEAGSTLATRLSERTRKCGALNWLAPGNLRWLYPLRRDDRTQWLKSAVFCRVRAPSALKR